MLTLSRIGWMTVGAAALVAFRILVEAALGRPGRIVDCDAIRRAGGA